MSGTSYFQGGLLIDTGTVSDTRADGEPIYVESRYRHYHAANGGTPAGWGGWGNEARDEVENGSKSWTRYYSPEVAGTTWQTEHTFCSNLNNMPDPCTDPSYAKVNY